MVNAIRRSLVPLALAGFALPNVLDAQADHSVSGGQIGGTATYTADVPATSIGHFLVHIISISNGPFPLAILNPFDPRLLDVGFELLQFAQVGIMPSTSNDVIYPVSTNPNLHGKALFAQYFTIETTTFLPDLVARRVDFSFGLVGQSHETLGDVTTTRQGHSVTRMADDVVLVLGGDRVNGSGTIVETVDTWEIYDPQNETFTTSPNTMSIDRSTHTATLLNDGRVLIIGGYQVNTTGDATASCEIYDPVTDTVSAAASMSDARTQHTATLLSDGRVFVAGGAEKFDLNDIFGSLATVLDTTEIYDPVSNTWSQGPDLPAPLFAHSASRLPNGRVLISAGVEVTILPFGLPVPSFTNSCHRYRPDNNTLQGAASIPGTSGFAYAAQVTMSNGDVLVAGGAEGDLVLLNFDTRTQCYSYDGGTNSWTSLAGLSGKRAYAQALDLGGDIVCIGGLESVNATLGTGGPQQAIEIYDVGLNTWSGGPASAMLLPREVSRSVVIDSGQKVLTIGNGDNGNGGLVDKTAEIYMP